VSKTDTPTFDLREAIGAKLGMSNREVQVSYWILAWHNSSDFCSTQSSLSCVCRLPRCGSKIDEPKLTASELLPTRKQSFMKGQSSLLPNEMRFDLLMLGPAAPRLSCCYQMFLGCSQGNFGFFYLFWQNKECLPVSLGMTSTVPPSSWMVNCGNWHFVDRVLHPPKTIINMRQEHADH
jgi:hypothetical protein